MVWSYDPGNSKIIGVRRGCVLDDAVKGADVIGKCCDYKAFLSEYDTAVAALGDSGMRLYWTEKLMEAGYQVPAIIHPSAVVSPSAVNWQWKFYHAECDCQYQYSCGTWCACQQWGRL